MSISIPDLGQYGFDNEYQAIYDMAFRYAREELYPLCERMDTDDWFPETAFRALAEHGLLGTTVDAQFGGPELDIHAQCLICEALSYWNHTLAASFLASDNLCLHNLTYNANAAQKQAYFPRFTSGKAIGALGMTEPGAGSVMTMDDFTLPSIIGCSHCSFCASVATLFNTYMLPSSGALELNTSGPKIDRFISS